MFQFKNIEEYSFIFIIIKIYRSLICLNFNSEYSDEKFQIPSGSSVVIKRVPAGSAPSNM